MVLVVLPVFVCAVREGVPLARPSIHSNADDSASFCISCVLRPQHLIHNPPSAQTQSKAVGSPAPGFLPRGGGRARGQARPAPFLQLRSSAASVIIIASSPTPSSPQPLPVRLTTTGTYYTRQTLPRYLAVTGTFLSPTTSPRKPGGPRVVAWFWR